MMSDSDTSQLYERIWHLTQEMATQAEEYEKKIDELKEDVRVANDSHEGQIRNTLAFQKERDEAREIAEYYHNGGNPLRYLHLPWEKNDE